MYVHAEWPHGTAELLNQVAGSRTLTTPRHELRQWIEVTHMNTHAADDTAPEDAAPEDVPCDDVTDEAEASTVDVNEEPEEGADDTTSVGEGAAGTDPPADALGEDRGKPEPFCDHLEDFVNRHFLPLIRRPLGGEFRWCAQWWRHAEAISRLTALWHAWEALRRQPGTGIGIWYRDHLDHQLPYLLGPRGPFFQCSEAEHIDPRRLRSEPAPPGWWP